MIKVGIIRTRSVTIALLSYARSAAAAARSISGPAPDFRILLGLAGNGRAHRTCGEPRLPPRLTPFDRRSGDTLAVLRACRGRFRNSGWSCFRCRSLASFHTRCTACTRSFTGCQRRVYWLPAPRDLRRSVVPSMRVLSSSDPKSRPPAPPDRTHRCNCGASSRDRPAHQPRCCRCYRTMKLNLTPTCAPLC